jgi:hypothetical protein
LIHTHITNTLFSDSYHCCLAHSPSAWMHMPKNERLGCGRAAICWGRTTMELIIPQLWMVKVVIQINKSRFTWINKPINQLITGSPMNLVQLLLNQGKSRFNCWLNQQNPYSLAPQSSSTQKLRQTYASPSNHQIQSCHASQWRRLRPLNWKSQLPSGKPTKSYWKWP